MLIFQGRCDGAGPVPSAPDTLPGGLLRGFPRPDGVVLKAREDAVRRLGGDGILARVVTGRDAILIPLRADWGPHDLDPLAARILGALDGQTGHSLPPPDQTAWRGLSAG